MRADGALLCLVTDRRRLCGPAAPFEESRRQLLSVIDEAVSAGVDLIQVRERGLETAELAGLVRAAVGAARRGATKVVVNDRLDVALACGADGVHLGSESFAPEEVRRITPGGFLIGRSVHNVEEARRHAPSVDYVIAGTVFPSASKSPATHWLGIAGLEAIVAAIRTPVLAIGGVTAERAADVAATGAAGIAAIGLFLPGGDPMAPAVAAVRMGFDSVWSAS
jgi:thiamine-phosphate pyrophosphorylase